MDYTSFAPGGSNNGPAMPPVSGPKKSFTPKFIGLIIALIVIGAAVYGAVWYWQQNQQEVAVPSFSPRPVDVTANWKTYSNDQYKVQLKYPNEFVLASSVNRSVEGFSNLPNGKNLDGVIVPKETFPKTNFAESYVVVSVDSHITTAADCKKYSNGGNQLTMSQTENINGISFSKAEVNDAGAGNFYDTKIYRVFHAGACYEVSVTLHTLNIGNFPTGTVTEVNVGQAWSKLVQVLNTFKFTDQVACTAEAKQCPDGSYVSRTGPDCQFAACPSASGSGTLSGHVDIGPNCPVERPGYSCTPSPEAYTSRSVLIFKSDGTWVATKNFDTQGNYSFSLAAGTYVVKSKDYGLYQDLITKGTVTIKSGQTTTLNFSIDTGIR